MMLPDRMWYWDSSSHNNDQSDAGFVFRRMDTYRGPRLFFYQNVPILHPWWLLPNDNVRLILLITIYIHSMVLNIFGTLRKLPQII